MSVKEIIEEKLSKTFQPDHLEVLDESHKHIGHAGARPEGETHFHVNMTAAAFNGKPRVDTQRMVYACLKDELAGPVHALSLGLKASDS